MRPNDPLRMAALSIVLLPGLASSAGSAQNLPPPKSESAGDTLPSSVSAVERKGCENGTTSEVVVCGRSQQRYRIDPAVLEATREADATPPKPPISKEPAVPCTGQECGGGTIPLVSVALTALKAAELAAAGDDWRDAFKTRADQYQVYQEMKQKESDERKVHIGLVAGNK